MPTYEYACPSCGIVEVYQSIKEKALTKCPQCKKRKVTRIVSVGGGVIFKGSGFWETDYNRSEDYKTKSKAESGDSTPSAAPKTEAKPQKSDASKPAEAPATTPAKPDSPPPKPPGSGKGSGGKPPSKP